jgi:hypothetical protein
MELDDISIFIDDDTTAGILQYGNYYNYLFGNSSVICRHRCCCSAA